MLMKSPLILLNWRIEADVCQLLQGLHAITFYKTKQSGSSRDREASLLDELNALYIRSKCAFSGSVSLIIKANFRRCFMRVNPHKASEQWWCTWPRLFYLHEPTGCNACARLQSFVAKDRGSHLLWKCINDTCAQKSKVTCPVTSNEGH